MLWLRLPMPHPDALPARALPVRWSPLRQQNLMIVELQKLHLLFAVWCCWRAAGWPVPPGARRWLSGFPMCWVPARKIPKRQNVRERLGYGMEVAAGEAHHIQKVKLAFQICAKSERPIAFINLFCDSPHYLSSVLLSNLPTPPPLHLSGRADGSSIFMGFLCHAVLWL